MAPRRHDFNENRKNKIKTGCRITGASDNHELFWQRTTRMNTDEHGHLPFPNDFGQRMTRIVRHRTTRTATDGVPGGGQHDEPRAHGTVMARAIAMTSTGPGARGLCVSAYRMSPEGANSCHKAADVRPLRGRGRERRPPPRLTS